MVLFEMDILLIDDEPLLIEKVLKFGSFPVDVCRDGAAGMDMLNLPHKEYDLIILDIRMPVMDGWQTLSAIRSNKRFDNVYILMLTADDLEDSLINGLNRGADEYITKPISPKRFLAHINSVERKIKQRQPAIPQAHNHLSKLSAREKEVLALVTKGYSNQQISEALCIATLTVKNHLRHIFSKLEVSNRTQASFVYRKSQTN